MNTVPVSSSTTNPTNPNHVIEFTGNDVPVFKIPSAPLLLNIPPPIPLKWQLAVPDEAHISTATPSPAVAPTQIMVKKQPNTPSTICVADITRILQQFGRYNDYDSCRNIVLHAFIHNDSSLLIPRDIDRLCSTFYCTTQSEYIHLTYKLHVALQGQHKESVSGKQLISIIQNKAKYGLLPHTHARRDILEILSALVAHDLLELSWYKTTFSSLFDESQSQMSFKDSDDYVYTLTDQMVKAFEAYTSSVLY